MRGKPWESVVGDRKDLRARGRKEEAALEANAGRVCGCEDREDERKRMDIAVNASVAMKRAGEDAIGRRGLGR